MIGRLYEREVNDSHLYVYAVTPVKTEVQSVLNRLKTLDSGWS